MSGSFESQIKDGVIKYIVQVLEQKRKFGDGLIIRKVKVCRMVYRKDQGLFVDPSQMMQDEMGS